MKDSLAFLAREIAQGGLRRLRQDAVVDPTLAITQRRHNPEIRSPTVLGRVWSAVGNDRAADRDPASDALVHDTIESRPQSRQVGRFLVVPCGVQSL